MSNVVRPHKSFKKHEEWLAETWEMIEEVANSKRGVVEITPRGCKALLEEHECLLKIAKI